MMAGIRGKDTQPEKRIRSALHALGYRYRLHVTTVPGKPDLVFPARRAVIFVNGCFWHGHNCPLFKVPSTRPDFWTQKIEANRKRDRRVRDQLEQGGWRHLTVWECTFRGAARSGSEEVIARIVRWLEGKSSALEIRRSQ